MKTHIFSSRNQIKQFHTFPTLRPQPVCPATIKQVNAAKKKNIYGARNRIKVCGGVLNGSGWRRRHVSNRYNPRNRGHELFSGSQRLEAVGLVDTIPTAANRGIVDTKFQRSAANRGIVDTKFSAVRSGWHRLASSTRFQPLPTAELWTRSFSGPRAVGSGWPRRHDSNRCPPRNCGTKLQRFAGGRQRLASSTRFKPLPTAELWHTVSAVRGRSAAVGLIDTTQTAANRGIVDMNFSSVRIGSYGHKVANGWPNGNKVANGWPYGHRVANGWSYGHRIAND
jgi:hypothetical protein